MASTTETAVTTPDAPEVKDIGALPSPPKDEKGDAADDKNALDGQHLEAPSLMRGNPAVVLNAVPDPVIPGKRKAQNTAAEEPQFFQQPADDDTLLSSESGVVVESELSVCETSIDGDLEADSLDYTDNTEIEDSDVEDP